MFHLQDHMLGRCQQSLSIQPEPHCHFQMPLPTAATDIA